MFRAVLLVDVDEHGVVGGLGSHHFLRQNGSVDAIRRSEQIRQVKAGSTVDQTKNRWTQSLNIHHLEFFGQTKMEFGLFFSKIKLDYYGH